MSAARRNPVPCSTYRLQFTDEFGFAAACDALDYLARLGVTDVYCSPLLRATSASTHGYDVADPTMLDPKFGGEDDFVRFSDALRRRGMGLILDIVPNHMAASVENPWWRDVLTHGRESRYAGHFDIDWQANGGRLLIPRLGAPLDEVLARGELRVEGDKLVYFDHRFPIAPGTAQAGDVGDVGAIVRAQHYELADWREQATRLNYRRFFDISDLVGMRVEREAVFDDVHRFVLQLVADGHVTGIRVDHVDGLRDPGAYLQRLQHELRRAAGHPDEPFWVVVEKILAPHETLPESWPVAGTTGYDFLDACDGLFVDRYGAARLAERYAHSLDDDASFSDIVDHAKLRIMRETFWNELGALAACVATRVAARPSNSPVDDATDRRIRDAIALVTASLNVYRTYVTEHARPAEDDLVIERALSDAAAHPAIDAQALAMVADAFRHDDELVIRWQQFSGPVTAKSVEDTAFYRYQALPARNEVGAHPAEPVAAAGSFHWLVSNLARQWPHTMNASSTHDTKRSEDVRARLLALTRRPDEWARTIDEWLTALDAPDINGGWMVASALVGAWPLSAERLERYVRKALREEKRQTSWTQPDERFEASMVAFAERLRVSGLVEPVVERITELGSRNAIAATALKLFAPGVPDTYQGTEVTSFALVDPDNRRPVDFARLNALLDSVDAPGKLSVAAGMLRARRTHRDLFERGNYLPLRTEAPGVIAFARRLDDSWALVAAAHTGFVDSANAMLELPAEAPARWRNVVTNDAAPITTTPIAQLLNGAPAIALVADQDRA